MAKSPGKIAEIAPDKRTSIKDILGVVGNTVSVASTVILVLSVIYEWAYFSVVGPKFRNIASLTDYLTSALDWLPLVIGGACIYVIGVILITMMSGLTDKVNDENAERMRKELEKTRHTDAYKKRMLWLCIFFIAVFGAAGFYFYSIINPATDLYFITICFVMVWIAVVSLAVTRGEDPAYIGNALKTVILIAPPLFVGVFLWGMQHGYADLSQGGETYNLSRKSSQPQSQKLVKVLRTFDRGILIRFAKATEFVRWDDVVSISLEPPKQAEK